MRLPRHLKGLVSAACLALALGTTLPATEAQAETRIASWNIKRLSEGSSDYQKIAQVISHFHLVAIQEVMEEGALMSLVRELQRQTGEEWGVMASHAIGRGSYKEHYAFIWRKSQVSFVDSAVVYLDDRDVFARETTSFSPTSMSSTGTPRPIANPRSRRSGPIGTGWAPPSRTSNTS
jgi:hypothetical protein